MAFSGQAATTTGQMPTGLTVANTTANDMILSPNTVWTTTDNIQTVESSAFDTKLGRNAVKRLVSMSCRIEELFEYKYRISPQNNAYGGYALSFNVAVSENMFHHDMNTPVPAWTESLLNDVQGDENHKIRKSELLHATAKMIFVTLLLRAGKVVSMNPPALNEPDAIAKTFIYEVAKGFVLKDAEVPEEALAKLALLTI